jgi:hypothetical protein
MRGGNRGAMRGRRGALAARGRNNSQNKPKTKDNLDKDLDSYMAKSKSYLDADIDVYMAQQNN